MARYAPRLARPGYLARWLRSGDLPDLTVPNMAAAASLLPASSPPTRRGSRSRRLLGRQSPGCAAVDGPS